MKTNQFELSIKRSFVAMALAFLMHLPVFGQADQQADTTYPSIRPNVLFLAVDDMNDWIGCLGKTPRAITPNIDNLAKSGVNFSNAHTAGVFCAPSRAALWRFRSRQRNQ
jgi:hypothetical protein